MDNVTSKDQRFNLKPIKSQGQTQLLWIFVSHTALGSLVPAATHDPDLDWDESRQPIRAQDANSEPIKAQIECRDV